MSFTFLNPFSFTILIICCLSIVFLLIILSNIFFMVSYLSTFLSLFTFKYSSFNSLSVPIFLSKKEFVILFNFCFELLLIVLYNFVFLLNSSSL